MRPPQSCSAFAVLGAVSPASAAGEGTILSLVNQATAANGLGPLRLNSAISAVSAAWANQMAANGAMTHNPSYASQMPGGWSKAAENVAMGYSSPTAVHEGWMNSPGHRANILGDYTDIGIAFVTANGTTWAVENFGKYGASVTPPASPAPPPALPAAQPAPPPPAPPAPPASPAPPAPAPTPPQEDSPPAPTEAAAPQLSESTPAPSSGSAESSRVRPLQADDRAAEVPVGLAGGAVGGVLAVIVVIAGILTFLLLRRRWGDGPRARS